LKLKFGGKSIRLGFGDWEGASGSEMCAFLEKFHKISPYEAMKDSFDIWRELTKLFSENLTESCIDEEYWEILAETFEERKRFSCSVCGKRKLGKEFSAQERSGAKRCEACVQYLKRVELKRQEEMEYKCIRCERTKLGVHFEPRERGSGRCKECQSEMRKEALEERKRKREIENKLPMHCSICKIDKTRGEFSNNQRQKGSNKKCKHCAQRMLVRAAKRRRVS